ncbi:LytTR family DNA-binding domain-containing protein [Streptococcus orisasini]|uniref:LytTR family DNA-binding domain-containing protein n=1 Tax=Streptococcus orisasini TaxID=1080071 RepID=UPI000710F8E1|nr:LytTR family DNA-binding domain-containing protein [Streptococcus orisasini]
MKLKIIKDPNFKEPLLQIYTHHIDKQTQEIIDFIKQKPNVIYGYKNKKLQFIPLENVVRIFTENKQVLIQTPTDTYLAKQRLYFFEQELGTHFIRISQGEIINIKYIKQLNLTIRGSIEVTLKNGITSFVARRSLKHFKEKLNL